MFGIATGYGRAGGSYRTIDVSSRIEGANPHGLVQILFDELSAALDTLVALGVGGDRGKRNERHARATAILHGLESSLDLDKGGEIARSLSQIYREARRLLDLAQRENNGAAAVQARDMIAEIAGAWREIA